MAINLVKGQRESLQAQRFTVGLGWGGGADLDVSVFILGENKRLLSDKHFVYYNNLECPNKAVIHAGGDLTGGGEDGDNEEVNIDLTKIDAKASELCIVASVYDEGVNFGQVRNAYIRIVDNGSGNELMKFELDEDFSIETAVEFGRIYKRNNEWKFEAVGVGNKSGLQGFVDKYQ